MMSHRPTGDKGPLWLILLLFALALYVACAGFGALHVWFWIFR